MEERVIVQSFDFRTLQYLHGKYPSMKTAMLVDEPEKDNRTFSQQLEDLGFTPTIHSPHHTLVTSEMVGACHRLQIKIVPWTVNDLNEMQSLINLGVDGIITDYPDIFSKLVPDTGPGSTAGSTTTTMSTSVTSNGRRVGAHMVLNVIAMVLVFLDLRNRSYLFSVPRFNLLY